MKSLLLSDSFVVQNRWKIDLLLMLHRTNVSAHYKRFSFRVSANYIAPHKPDGEMSETRRTVGKASTAVSH